jgi:hypothetical protein
MYTELLRKPKISGMNSTKKKLLFKMFIDKVS